MVEYGYTRKRRDLQVETNQALCSAVARQLDGDGSTKGYEGAVVEGPRDAKDLSEDTRDRLEVRRSLLEERQKDPNGFERVIGRSDLMSINYLARGLAAADAVCRIRVPDDRGEWYGTGFLAGRGLLVTNHHVLATPREASQAEAEFGYQHDVEGVLQRPVAFNLDPTEIFFTDADLDITVVSVTDRSEGGVPLERFGYLPLLPISGKGVAGEHVTIPQHPGGMPKQMSVRSNQIVELEPDAAAGIDPMRFIHYVSDTEPGSSGAPVLNDQWQVVAVHHRAIADPKTDPKVVHDDDAEVRWLANEGVRISAISQRLQYLRFSNVHVARALERIETAIGLPSRIPVTTPTPVNAAEERDVRPHKPEKWNEWQPLGLGYDPNFLGTPIDLNDMLGDRTEDAAELLDGSGVVLDYLHFSTVLHQQRKFAILTAVNVAGGELVHPGDRPSSWRTDIRIADDVQPDGEFYEKKKGDDPVQFSRGHLVRALDPCWGTEEDAKLAQLHTFHYTNAAPQVQGFNVGDWLDIEDYVLNEAQVSGSRVSLFTGPVFRESDPIYGKERKGGPWQVPVSYWKVAVLATPDGSLSATAFIQGQAKFVQALLTESLVFSNLRKNTLAELQSENLQTTLAVVEHETGLDFGSLKDVDVGNDLESTRRTRLLRSLDEIRL